MIDASNSDLEEVRNVLLGHERAELAELRLRVQEVEELQARLEEVERLLLEATIRAESVGEVLVDAVHTLEGKEARLGHSLQPSVEHAIHLSARDEGTALADALYPVMGPAIRKMIASIFTSDANNRGQTFRVDQILLIERTSGVLLAATANDDDALEEADIVSGMLDAIRLFVQDAFDKSENDGLQDLRVGDTVVLVEWGPKAVLASVISGIPDDDYRNRAAAALEAIHADHEASLNSFDGSVDVFNQVVPSLQTLQVDGSAAATGSAATASIFWWLLAAVAAVGLAIIVASSLA